MTPRPPEKARIPPEQRYLEVYNNAQFYSSELTDFLRIFSTRGKWSEEERSDPKARQRKSDSELVDLIKELHGIFQVQQKKLHNRGAPRTEDEKYYGLLHPVVIAEAMLKKLPFDEREKKDVMEIIRKSFPEDRIMGAGPTEKQPGYYAKRSMPVIVGSAHLFAKLMPDESVCLVEGDFTNLKMCNRTLGHDGTDKLLHEIATVVKSKFEKAAANQGGAEVQCVRQGGDELRLVVYGLKKSTIDTILKQEVHPALNLLAARFGVQGIEHTKGGNPPGFGAAFASATLDEYSAPENVAADLDKAITRQKEHDGFLRLGVFSKEDEKRFVDEVFRPGRSRVLCEEYKKQGMSENQIEARVQNTVEREIKENEYKWLTLARSVRVDWERLIGGGAYSEDYKKSGASNPQEFFNYITKTQKGDLDAIRLPKLKPIEERVPFYGQEVNVPKFEDPEIIRLRKAYKHFAYKDPKFAQLADSPYHFSQFDQESRQYTRSGIEQFGGKDPTLNRLHRMVTDSMHYYDAHDPASLSKSDALMLEDAQDFAAQYGGVKVMVFELANLSGLNKLGHDLGNALLREAHEQIQTALRVNPGPGGRYTHAADHVYDLKGGVFAAFVPPEYSPEAAEGVMNHLRKWMQEKNIIGYHQDKGVLNTPVVKFAEAAFAKSKKGDLKALKIRLETTARKQPDEETQTLSHAQQLEKPPHKTASQITMGEIPNPRGGKLLDISRYFDDSSVIKPTDDIDRRLEQVKDAAQEHFENTPGRRVVATVALH